MLIKNSTQNVSAHSVTRSIKELAVDLMAADQVQFSCRLLQNAIDNDIIDDDIMTLYSACIRKFNKSDCIDGDNGRKADILKATVVCN